jgi:hypothetical protein
LFLSFDGAAHEPLDVVTLEGQVEDHAGHHGDHGAGDQVAVVDRAEGPGLDVEQGDGEGELALLGQERERGVVEGPFR